jgi:hypothetical protein
LFIHVLQIVPLLSQSSHPLPASVDTERLEALTKRIQFGGDEVVKAKDGTGSATLSMAYAGAEFTSKILKALTGEKGLIAPSYVHLEADREGGATVKKEIGRDLDYFSTNVEIGVSWLQLFLLKFSSRLTNFTLGIDQGRREDHSSWKRDGSREAAHLCCCPRTCGQH